MPDNPELTIVETLLHVVRYLAGSIPSGHNSSRPLSAVLPELEAIVEKARAEALKVVHGLEQSIDTQAAPVVPVVPATPLAPAVDKLAAVTAIIDKAMAIPVEPPVAKVPVPPVAPPTK